MTNNEKPLYSLVVPVCARTDDLTALLGSYADALQTANVDFELIAVLDGPKEAVYEELKSLCANVDWLKVIQFSREFGESVALMAGFKEAQGDVLMTLPAYWQVDPTELPKLIDASDEDDDMVIAVRSPRSGSSFERIRRRLFHGLLKFITGQEYRDLGCGVRLLKRRVADEIPLYGDQHRFLPVLAMRRGFDVREVEVTQSPKDIFRGHYRVRDYVHRVLDILTVFFLVRFTKKPLRFFGSIGFLTMGFGGIFVLVLVVQRLFYNMPLAERPALLLSSLLIVLGVQVFALGLLGELIIFSNADKSKDYTIRGILSSESNRSADEDSAR